MDPPRSQVQVGCRWMWVTASPRPAQCHSGTAWHPAVPGCSWLLGAHILALPPLAEDPSFSASRNLVLHPGNASWVEHIAAGATRDLGASRTCRVPAASPRVLGHSEPSPSPSQGHMEDMAQPSRKELCPHGSLQPGFILISHH